MLYSTLLVAAATLSSFAWAQDSDSPDSNITYPAVGACCNVSANDIPQSLRTSWCQAQENTCPEICGGLAQVANSGNNCDETTLNYTCNCRNGTSPQMSEYQQSVPGQMCRFWYDACVAQTGSDRDAQFQCQQARDQNCGNLTTTDPEETSSSSASSTPTATGGSSGESGSSSATGSAGASESSGAAAALDVARHFGTPVLAGGILAVFGLAL
ncbi:hypothetical protein BS50DRAFT_506222 [Corynespora cassiicola Philippines]|uniref:DUF7707 domain-containing protein n=1 Tax=Corynespora cassiicola Philippines TaxID=1448308 RepID=A0A2T2N5F3_CORCC|nr:hypothetical protein BS50DRAFT_506222 [Corynespora cassiicola Philippines]